MALRTKSAVHRPVEWAPFLEICQHLVVKLADLTRTRTRALYAEQYEQVMQCLERAFAHRENNSLLVLARSKQIIHSLLARVIADCAAQQQEAGQVLKVVRVNTTLLDANEQKILMRLCEIIGLAQKSKELYTVEMITEIQKYFEANAHVALLFVFEDIDFYVAETKQVLLYKILDMLQYCQIRFVFVATSMKVDVVDHFEKRIKSRFSHRQVLLYAQSYPLFMQQLELCFAELNQVYRADPLKHEALKMVHQVTLSAQTKEMLTDAFEFGK